MGAADIANKPWYAMFEQVPPMVYPELLSGVKFVRPHTAE